MTWIEFIASLFKDTTVLLGNLAWPVLGGFALYLFRTQLNKLISRLRSISQSGDSLLFQFAEDPERKPERLPSPKATVLHPDEVKEILKNCSAVDNCEVDEHYKQAHEIFLSAGIVTSAQLQALINSSEVVETLSELYIKFLDRNPGHPLDPTGLATYGSVLFKKGNRQEVIEAIINSIKNSYEFRAKHPKRVVTQVMRDILNG